MTITSATGSGAVYLIQPANGNNVLRIDGFDSTKTLTLVTPTAYSQIFVLATGGSGGNNTTTGTIHYASGGSQAFVYTCFDWCNNANHPEAAIPNLGRGSRGGSGTQFGYLHECYFGIYETPIATTSSTDPIVSIDFDPDPTIGKINIFGISGQ